MRSSWRPSVRWTRRGSSDVVGDARDRALGSGVTQYVTLHGLVQHHVYHAGQISLLKKAQQEGS